MSHFAACVLQLVGVAKRYGRKVVLQGVDLRVHQGEVVALLGPNGAGKTTLLAIASGLLPVSEGRCDLAGDQAWTLATRRKVAFVAHTTQLYPRLSARENLELFAALWQREGARPVLDALARFGLLQSADARVETFSRGMMQRLALARAWAAIPDLWLLDEPFTALDRTGAALLREVVSEERARGAALLLTSHDLAAIAMVSDRAVALEEGRVSGHASLDSRPREQFQRALEQLLARGSAP